MTTALDAIADNLEILFTSNWAESRQTWGERIQMYRDYIDGKHRLEMTQEVADLLMIDKEEGERFTVNYCKLIMQKPADRLKVTSIKALPLATDDDADDATKETAKDTADKLTKWADRFRHDVRFDGKQIDNHEMTIGSGDNFVVIDSAPLAAGTEFPAMIIEPAYNGSTGIVPIYDLKQQHMIAVAKIWESGGVTIRKGTTETDAVTRITMTTDDESITEFRVNVYYPNRIEKFVTVDGKLHPFVDASEKVDGKINNTHITAWLDEDKKPLGIPFVHFKNDSRSGKWNGEAHIKSAIPLNDVLNRATMSLTLIAELTGAQIRYVIGAETPDGRVSPGVWVGIKADGVDKEQHMPKVGTFDIGEVTPIVEESTYLIEQIGAVTETPLPGTMGSSVSSGEALKQREIGFTAQVKKLQTKFGNNWEDVIDIAYRVQMALGKAGKPPEGANGWETVWMPAEIRNDTEVIDNALKIAPIVDNRTVLEEIAPIYKWDAARIDLILERLSQQTADQNGTQPFNQLTPGGFANTLTETLPGDLDAVTAAALATGG